MTEAASGWRPLQKPAGGHRLPRISALTGRSPFARLALVHVLAVAGDTLITMALAGSLFFSISPHAARNRVALYLLLTMAPFAVVAPLLGPVLDRSRSGRRIVVIVCHAGRALVCLSMARHLHGLLLFPEAFVVLVLSKAYLVTKGALVPATVADDRDLVQANARLAVLGVVAGFVAAGPGVLVLKLSFLGAAWVLRLAAVVLAAGAIAGIRLARTEVARHPPERTPAEAVALRSRGILLAASAMAVLRGAVGFLTFLLAFSFRRAHAPSWWFGVALAASLAGTLVGALLAPRVRRMVGEERILTASLVMVAVAGALGAQAGGRAAGAALAGVLGLAANTAKLAFDSIVQRDAPDAGRGRAFARFETRFQLVWVAAALVPVLIPIPIRVGMALLAAATMAAAVFYIGGRRHEHAGSPAAGG